MLLQILPKQHRGLHDAHVVLYKGQANPKVTEMTAILHHLKVLQVCCYLCQRTYDGAKCMSVATLANSLSNVLTTVTVLLLNMCSCF